MCSAGDESLAALVVMSHLDFVVRSRLVHNAL